MTNKIALSKKTSTSLISYNTLDDNTDPDDNSDIIDNENILHFNITLSVDEWKKIYDSSNVKPYHRSDKKNTFRNYETLTSYVWSSLINEHFFEQTRLNCTLIYKHAKVYKNGQVYLDVFAFCSVCMSNFKGVVIDKPEVDSRVIINCTFNGNFKSCESGKKRRIIGEKRDFYLKMLVEGNQSAAYV